MKKYFFVMLPLAAVVALAFVLSLSQAQAGTKALQADCSAATGACTPCGPEDCRTAASCSVANDRSEPMSTATGNQISCPPGWRAKGTLECEACPDPCPQPCAERARAVAAQPES